MDHAEQTEQSEQPRQELVTSRQDLRQIMTLREEAVLVLNRLLD